MKIYRGSVGILACIACLLFTWAGECRLASAEAPHADLQDAPLPSYSSSLQKGMFAVLPVPSPEVHIPKLEQRTHKLLRNVVLPAALTADMVTTYLNMTHPRRVSFIQNNTCTNGIAIVPCPPELAQSFSDLDVSGLHYFEEGGWARFMGSRDAPGVIGANIALDWAMEKFVDRKLWKKHGEFGRKESLALLGWKSGGHIWAAVENMRSIHLEEHLTVPKDSTDIYWY